jgi:hypothetical protein
VLDILDSRPKLTFGVVAKSDPQFGVGFVIAFDGAFWAMQCYFGLDIAHRTSPSDKSIQIQAVLVGTNSSLHIGADTPQFASYLTNQQDHENNK